MALLSVDTISDAVKARPYYLTQVTSEKSIKAAFLDIKEAYLSPATGEGFAPVEGGADETLYNIAAMHLTYARLLFSDVGKLAYSTAKAMKDNTSLAGDSDLKRTVAMYRRLGVARLEELRANLGMHPCIFKSVPILGENL